MALPLLLNTALRAVEQRHAQLPLMRRAGEAAGDWAMQLAHDALPVLILAGPGNNGGDAFEAASTLTQHGFGVQLVFIADAQHLSPEARAAHDRWLATGGLVARQIPDLPRWGLVMDGLFGIGLKRPPAADYAALITAANQIAARDACPLLALDCPSGLDADRGMAHSPTITASHTLTFISAKPGLYTGDGPDHAGQIRLAPLGLLPADLLPADGWLSQADDFHLRPRRQNSHKGSYGSAGILGGASGMAGAVLLAARAALKSGCGRVFAGFADPAYPSVDLMQPELMLRTAEALFALPLTALACGPGLGEAGMALLKQACLQELPLVLDADALNLLAINPALQQTIAKRLPPTLLTPHPAEAARLLGCSTGQIGEDRIAAARELAHRFAAHVVLKGCGSIVCTPEGRWRVNSSGNPGLATAGSGDVLTGIVVSLLAQGVEPEQALAAAVWLHGRAADDLAGKLGGPVGMTAGELPDAVRALLNRAPPPNPSKTAPRRHY